MFSGQAGQPFAFVCGSSGWRRERRVTSVCRHPVGAEVWSSVLIEIAKIGGPPAALTMYALRAGFHKVWVWGWLLEKAETINSKLQEKVDALEKKVDEMRLEINKEIRDRMAAQSELNLQIAQLNAENRTLREQLSKRRHQEP